MSALGSIFGSTFGSVFGRRLSVFGSIIRSVIRSVFGIVFGSVFRRRDLQAFYYWEVPRPSTYYYPTTSTKTSNAVVKYYILSLVPTTLAKGVNYRIRLLRLRLPRYIRPLDRFLKSI